MILSTLLTPPKASTEAAEAVERGRGRVTAYRERARRYQRTVAIGVIASVAIHVFLIWISPLVVRYLEPGWVVLVPPPAPSAAMDEMVVIEYRVTETPPVQREPERTEPEVETPTPGTESAPPLPTAADRLRPRVGDWRLWVVPPLAERAEPTDAERAAAVRDRLRAALAAYDDSAAAAAALEAEALDWTVGEDGNKWGVSPGKIHLGPLTLPLPFGLGPTREAAERQAEYDEIRRQAGQAGIDETFEERVKAIRERRERERRELEQAQQDTTPKR